MAGSAGIRNVVLVGHLGSNEAEGMSMHESVRRPFGLDLRHVTGHTLASRGTLLMVRMLFQSGRARPVWRERPMAVQAEYIGGLDKLGVVISSMHIMATEAGDAVTVHDALYEIVALHAVFMSGAIGEVIKVGCPQRRDFKLPIILQFSPDLVTNWPVVIFALDRN